MIFFVSRIFSRIFSLALVFIVCTGVHDQALALVLFVIVCTSKNIFIGLNFLFIALYHQEISNCRSE